MVYRAAAMVGGACMPYIIYNPPIHSVEWRRKETGNG